MKQEYFLRILAFLSLLLGSIGVAGAFLVAEISPARQFASVAIGLLLVAAAFLLATKRKSALPMLWLSAVAYIASMLYPAFNRHGEHALSFLMEAFFWSAGFRLSLAALAQAAFSSLAARLWKN